MNADEDRKREQRIRERAYRIWQDEGRPSGRGDVHWDMATELVAIEDNYRLTTEPVPSPDQFGPSGEPIEPIAAVENLGEFPTMTDQGEEQPYPTHRPAADAVQGLQPAHSDARVVQEPAPASLSVDVDDGPSNAPARGKADAKSAPSGKAAGAKSTGSGKGGGKKPAGSSPRQR